MSRAVLHIGTKKTGTTYLQQFLPKNAVLLRHHGLHYPDFLRQTNHTKLVAGFIPITNDIHRSLGLTDERTTAAYLANLSQLFDTKFSPGADQRWIFTSEALSARLVRPDQIERFRDWMSRWFDEFEVVLYLRRQDFMAPSLYSTYIRNGGHSTWGIAELTGKIFDIADTVNNWTAVFGADAMTVRPYLESQTGTDYLLADFLSAIRLPINYPWIRSSTRDNPRLSSAAVELLRLINESVVSGKARPLISRKKLANYLAEATPGAAWEYPELLLRQVRHHFKETNEAMVATLAPNDPRWYEWLEHKPADSIESPSAESALSTELAINTMLGAAQTGLLAADSASMRGRHLAHSRGSRFDRLAAKARLAIKRRISQNVGSEASVKR